MYALKVTSITSLCRLSARSRSVASKNPFSFASIKENNLLALEDVAEELNSVVCFLEYQKLIYVQEYEFISLFLLEVRPLC